MKQKSKKDITNLHFKNMTEEIQFWDSVDLGDYLTEDDVEAVVFPNLKVKTKTISLRLPADLIFKVKAQAKKVDIPYQSLLKQAIHEKFA